MVALQRTLGDEFDQFQQSLGSLGKVSFVLGSELWKDKFGSLLLKVIYWRCGARLYGDNPCVQQPQSQTLSLMKPCQTVSC